MGLFGNKEYKQFLSHFDNINDASSSIILSKKENFKNSPLGTFAKKVVEQRDNEKTKLIINNTYKDVDDVEAIIIQHILNEESIVVLDPEARLYKEFHYMLRNRNYRIKYIDVDSDDTATWSVFDGDNMDAEDIYYRCNLLLNIFKNDYMDTDEIHKYFDKWVIMFSGLFSYVISKALLNSNKFEFMLKLLEDNSISELNGLFFHSNDIVDIFWFNENTTPEELEYLISLTLAVLDELADPDTNKLLTNSDMDFINLATVPTAYFLNPIPDDVTANIPLNVILSYSLTELNDFFLMTNSKNIVPVHYIINNLDYFPGFSFFMQMSSEIKTNKISFTYTCSDLSFIAKSYDKNILNAFFNKVYFTIIHNNNKNNLKVISQYIIDIDFDIPQKFIENNCIIIAYDKTIYCELYNIEDHPLFEQLMIG